MGNKKGSIFTNEKFSFRGPSKRFIAIISIVAASILFYGFTPSADEESPLTSVTIVDGENYFEVETKGQTVGDALCVADITLGENDSVSKDLGAEIKDGETITVNRGKLIFLNTSGTTFEIRTNAATVGDALISDGFQVGKYDEVVPDVNTPTADGMTVSVTRVYVEVYEVNEEIPFTEKTITNDEKEAGYKNVIQEGKPGTLVRTFKKVSKDGAGVTATLIGESVASQPVEQIIEIGTKQVSEPAQPPAGTNTGANLSVTLTPGKTADGVPFAAIPTMAQNNTKTTTSGNTAVTAYGTFTFSKVINAKATAYEGSSASNGKWAGKTATGRAPVFGVVAVDPSVIPLNSKLYIESSDGGKSWIYGFAVAGDTGGAIKGNKIDLCYNTLDQCYQFGRRDAVVYVLN